MVDVALLAGQYKLRASDDCLSTPITYDLPYTQPADFPLSFYANECVATYGVQVEASLMEARQQIYEGLWEAAALGGTPADAWQAVASDVVQGRSHTVQYTSTTADIVAHSYAPNTNNVAIRLKGYPMATWGRTIAGQAPRVLRWDFSTVGAWAPIQNCDTWKGWIPYAYDMPGCPPYTMVVTKNTTTGQEVYRETPIGSMEQGQNSNTTSFMLLHFMIKEEHC